MIEIKPASKEEIVFYEESEIRDAAKRLMDRITLQPSRIVIHNQTKGVQVRAAMNQGLLHIVIVNPEDEVFKL